MARTLLCFLIIPFSFAAGRMFSQKLSGRRALLSEIKLMLKETQSYLSFEGLPTAEIIEKLKSQKELSRLSFLNDVSTLLSSKLPFPSAWESALSKNVPQYAKRCDIEVLASFGKTLGAFSEETQLLRIKLLENRTDELLLSSAEEEKTSGALINKLCVFAGITLFILVL